MVEEAGYGMVWYGRGGRVYPTASTGWIITATQPPLHNCQIIALHKIGVNDLIVRLAN